MLSLLFLLLITVIDLGAAQYSPGYEYHEEVSGWLKLHRVPATWEEARYTCQLEGGILASPVCEPMLKVLTDLMSNSSLYCPVFSGIHATFSEGHYYTVDGIPLSQIPAKWVESYDVMNSKCGEVFEDCTVFKHDGTLSGRDCTDKYPYACFKKEINTKNPCSYGVGDSAYNLDNKTGSCYKYHNERRDWPTAFKICSEEGAHLAIVNSQMEAKVLTEIFKKNLGDDDRSRENVLLGFLDWGQHGKWTTIHGETLEEAGYATWAPNAVIWDTWQPRRSELPSYYGGMNDEGQFIYVSSHRSYIHPFICEKPPEHEIMQIDVRSNRNNTVTGVGREQNNTEYNTTKP